MYIITTWWLLTTAGRKILLPNLKYLLHSFVAGEDDPEAVLSLQSDEDGTLEFVLIMTSQMKETFSLFPEVLMIDCTYCTNKLRMPLFTVLVEDGDGLGQVVGYAFVSNERKFTLQAVLTEFSRVNDTSNVKVVVLDKDMSEIAAVNNVMPQAIVQICKFHVLQAVRREVLSLAVDSGTKDKINSAFRRLVFAKTELSFKKAHAKLAAVAPDSFMNYYNKNWGQNKKSWAYYLTITTVNMGNTTNNRSESHNQKIKDVLNRKLSLADCVKSIMLYHRTNNFEVCHREFNQLFKTPYRLGDNDEVCDAVVKSVTSYAAGIIIHELTRAREKTDVYAQADCICSMSKTMLLPCRHIFAKRLKNGEEIFNLEDVGQRWHLSYQKRAWNFTRKAKNRRSGDDDEQLRDVQQLKRKKTVPKTKAEKYNEMLFLCTSVADYCSGLGTPDFDEKYDTLSTLYDMWLHNKKVVLVSPEEETLQVNDSLPEADKAAPSSPMYRSEPMTGPSEEAETDVLPTPLYDDHESVVPLADATYNVDSINDSSGIAMSITDDQTSFLPKPAKTSMTDSPVFSPSPSRNKAGTPMRTNTGDYSPPRSLSKPDSCEFSPLSSPKQPGTPMPDIPEFSPLHSSSLPRTPLLDLPVQSTSEEQEVPGASMPASSLQKEPELSTKVPKVISPILKGSKRKVKSVKNNVYSKCITGATRNILKNFHEIKLPRSPPVRGNIKSKNQKRKKIPNKENVYEARQRKLSRSSKTKRKTVAAVKSDDLNATLRNPHAMLCDQHIAAASNLLREQFPLIAGLQDPILGSRLQFDIVNSQFVQILHNGELHWVVASDIHSSKSASVELYDSLYTTVSMPIKMQISAVMMVQQKRLEISVQNFQRQKGGVDCGVFAIAAATDLCYGQDPCTKFYMQDKMRPHLLDCVEKGKMTPFPASVSAVDERTKRKIQVPVWCICRLPDNGEEKMAQCCSCKNWYHKTCQSIPKAVFQSGNALKKWECRECEEKLQKKD